VSGCIFSCAPETFDINGALYYIATEGHTLEYANPHLSGEVVSKISSVPDEYYGSPERLVMHGHDGTTNCTGNQTNQWMSVDLGEHRSLIPNRYCLRHGSPSGGYRLRWWRFEGSNDENAWTVLRSHADENTMPAKGFGVTDWLLEGVTKAYRHFRIIQTGPNSWGTHSLSCRGLELYGVLQGQNHEAVPSMNPRSREEDFGLVSLDAGVERGEKADRREEGEREHQQTVAQRKAQEMEEKGQEEKEAEKGPVERAIVTDDRLQVASKSAPRPHSGGDAAIAAAIAAATGAPPPLWSILAPSMAQEEQRQSRQRHGSTLHTPRGVQI
jgi:hypothetical protein